MFGGRRVTAAVAQRARGPVRPVARRCGARPDPKAGAISVWRG